MLNHALRTLEIQNFRAHKDTGPLNFSSLNLFVGANNSGKTSILACIEVFLRGLCDSGGPLWVDAVPQFSSFDAAARKSWSRGVPRPTKINLSYEMATDEPGQIVSCKYVLGESEYGGGVSIDCAEIDAREGGIRIDLKSRKVDWRLGEKTGTYVSEKSVPFFYRLVPMLFHPESPELMELTTTLTSALRGESQSLEVVNPHRPAPRSLYVLDDTSLRAEDKELVGFLVENWMGRSDKNKAIRDRIREGMHILNLAESFEIKEATTRKRGGVFEIVVAPTRARQKVSLADAGFGLSQVLPLLVADARMDGGFLVAYQPELHLHPFAQSRLADVFAKSIERGNQLFIETHSVDLVLGIQRLIAEKAIAAESVALFFVENTGSSATVEKVGFNSRGAPEKPFPKGFMDVSLETARHISTARLSADRADQ